MIDIDEYEGLTIDDWYKMNHHDWKDVVNEHNDLLVEVKRLQTIMHEIEHNNGVTAEVVAASGDALFINELLAEVKRLRSIADDLYAYIVSDAGISLKIIEEQMDWRDEE